MRVIHMFVLLAVVGCGPTKEEIAESRARAEAEEAESKRRRELEELRKPAIAALRREDAIKDLAWNDFNSDILNVGVLDNGSSRTGYAMYVCEVLREHGVADGVTVKIKDITDISRDLGESKC